VQEEGCEKKQTPIFSLKKEKKKGEKEHLEVRQVGGEEGKRMFSARGGRKGSIHSPGLTKEGKGSV